MIKFLVNTKNTKQIIFYLIIATAISLIPISSAIETLIIFTLIGIPFIVLKQFVPVISLIIILAHIFFHLLFFLGGKWRSIIATILALCTLGVLPFVENQRQSKIAEMLIASDFNKITKPVNIDILALDFGSNNSGLCAEFCLRVLLNNQVQKVIIPNQHPDDASSNTNREAVAFWLASSATCSSFDTKLGKHMNLGKKFRGGELISPKKLLFLKAAQGVCLQSTKANFSDANAILSSKSIIKGDSNYKNGFTIFGNTASAKRISFYLRQEGKIKLVYQETGVKLLKLLPILWPAILRGFRDERKIGFARRFSAYGSVVDGKWTLHGYRARSRKIQEFFVDTLGAKLFIPQNNVVATRRKLVTKALSEPGKIDFVTMNVIKDYYKASITNNHEITKHSQLFLNIFTDKRIILPNRSAKNIHKVLTIAPHLNKPFADNVFKRLREINPINYKERRSDFSDQIYYLSRGAAQLPDNILIEYKSDLFRLARNREARVFADRLLQKIHIFGADAIPILLHLIGDDKRPLLFEGRTIPWKAMRRAGFFGLCRLGSVANSAIPEIFNIAESNVFKNIHGTQNLSIGTRTLLRLGASSEEIWNHGKIVREKHTLEKYNDYVLRFNKSGRC